MMANGTTEGRHAVQPGHQYRFGLRKDEGIRWWRVGRKKDVLAPIGEAAALGELLGQPIVFAPIEPVHFEVEHVLTEL